MFYNRKVKSIDIKQIRSFLKDLDIGLQFCYLPKDTAGTYTGDLKYIKLCNRYEYSLRELLSTIFHEMSHIILTREGKYKIYHKKHPRIFTKKERKHVIRYGLKVEIEVDKFAEKIMKCYFPTIPFEQCYRDYETQESWRKWAEENFLEE